MYVQHQTHQWVQAGDAQVCSQCNLKVTYAETRRRLGSDPSVNNLPREWIWCPAYDWARNAPRPNVAPPPPPPKPKPQPDGPRRLDFKTCDEVVNVLKFPKLELDL